MTYIDAIILNSIERCCRSFQKLTGKTNLWLAAQLTNLSIIVYVVWAVMYSWRAPVGWRVAVAVFCVGLLYVLTQTILKVPIEASETEAYRRLTQGLRNPRRLRDALLRISFLTLALYYPILYVYLELRIGVVVLLSYSLIVLTTVVLYLLACDPLPPCTGKVTEWMRGLTASRVAASESSAE